METLGEDLVLLSIRPGSGRIATRQRIGYGLRGSELVRLAASGRIAIANDRIVVLDDGPTGDERLDAALVSLVRARRPEQPKSWVSRPGARICDAYLARLAAAGAIREERGKLLGFIAVTRWRIVDAAARAATDAATGAATDAATQAATHAAVSAAVHAAHHAAAGAGGHGGGHSGGGGGHH